MLIAHRVEKPLKHHILLRRRKPQGGADVGRILRQLPRRGGGQAQFALQPVGGGVNAAAGQLFIDVAAQAGHSVAQFIGAAWRFAEPEGDAGGLSMGVRDAYLALLHPEDAISRIAQLEDVPGQAFKGEILVQRADGTAFRFQDHIVVELIRDHPAIGQGGQPGARPGSEAAVDRVVVEVPAAPAAAGGEALVQHLQELAKFRFAELPVGPGAGKALKQLVFSPFPACRFRHNLLRQHIQGALRHRYAIQFIAPRRVQERGALHQIVPAQGKQTPLGGRA